MWQNIDDCSNHYLVSNRRKVYQLISIGNDVHTGGISRWRYPTGMFASKLTVIWPWNFSIITWLINQLVFDLILYIISVGSRIHRGLFEICVGNKSFSSYSVLTNEYLFIIWVTSQLIDVEEQSKFFHIIAHFGRGFFDGIFVCSFEWTCVCIRTFF